MKQDQTSTQTTVPVCQNRHIGCLEPAACGTLGHCGDAHPDDAAVDRFAVMMKDKLAQARAKGRSGWQECPETYLISILWDHIDKGDMRDVANIAMMIHLNREATEPMPLEPVSLPTERP